MAMFPEPFIAVPEGIEALDPFSNYKTHKSENSIIGEREFTFPFVAMKKGQYEIGPVSFYYFDPVKNVYDSLAAGSLKVTAEGEEIASLASGNTGANFYRDEIKGASDEIQGSSDPLTKWTAVAATALLALTCFIYFSRRKTDLSKKTEAGKEYNPLD
jgi:preprotein translocase subunit SecG